MHYFMFFLVLQSSCEDERAGRFAFIVFLMFCYIKCPVALPHGTVGGSAICDCGIS